MHKKQMRNRNTEIINTYIHIYIYTSAFRKHPWLMTMAHVLAWSCYNIMIA